MRLGDQPLKKFVPDGLLDLGDHSCAVHNFAGIEPRISCGWLIDALLLPLAGHGDQLLDPILG